MATSVKEIGAFLESQAHLGQPITYGAVIKKFPDLPPLTEYWKSHPLCDIFGELDGEDHRNNRPFRTALVYAVDTTRPGNGFFENLARLRGTTIMKSEEDKVWVAELDALKAYYR